VLPPTRLKRTTLLGKNMNNRLLPLVAFFMLAIGARANPKAITDASTEFRRLYVAAIAPEVKESKAALSIILQVREISVDREEKILVAIWTQGIGAKNRGQIQIVERCRNLTIQSMDALNQYIAHCLDALKLSGIGLTPDLESAALKVQKEIRKYRSFVTEITFPWVSEDEKTP
jgi:hypothetical protein